MFREIVRTQLSVLRIKQKSTNKTAVAVTEPSDVDKEQEAMLARMKARKAAAEGTRSPHCACPRIYVFVFIILWYQMVVLIFHGCIGVTTGRHTCRVVLRIQLNHWFL